MLDKGHNQKGTNYLFHALVRYFGEHAQGETSHNRMAHAKECATISSREKTLCNETTVLERAAFELVLFGASYACTLHAVVVPAIQGRLLWSKQSLYSNESLYSCA
eukprot:6245729-Amphidinium_carterae.2